MLTNLETLPIIGGMVVGMLAALGYFGGLWWTVRQLPETAHPLRFYASSIGVRLISILSVFYGLLVGWGGVAFAAGFFSFFATRIVMIRCLQPPLRDESTAGKTV